MSTYKIDKVKPQSSRKRWEFWRERGIVIIEEGKYRVLLKDELDEYTDSQIWQLEHPGMPTVIKGEFNDGVSAEGEQLSGVAGSELREESGDRGPEG